MFENNFPEPLRGLEMHINIIIVLAIQQLQFSKKIQSRKMPEYSFYLFFFSVN